MTTYVYAVVAGDTAAPPDADRGVGRESSLRLVVDGPLAAVVGTAPDSMRGTPKDLEAHAGVVERLSSTGTTLPVRFGMVLEDDDAVVDQLLRRHGDRLRAMLAEFDGKVELRLRARYDREAQLRRVVQAEPTIRSLNERVKGASPARRHSLQIRLGELVAAALEHEQQRDAARILAALTPLATDHRVMTAPAELVALTAAFLVDRAAERRFEEHVRAQDDASEGRITSTLVGPLPPWDFVELGGP